MNITKEYIDYVSNDCDFNFADTVAEIVEYKLKSSSFFDGYNCGNEWIYDEVELFNMKLECEIGFKEYDSVVYPIVENIKLINNDSEMVA